MTRWLVTGSAGALGREVAAALDGRRPGTLRHDELDITDAGAVAQAVAGYDVVVNCAAWTDVDAAEADEAGAFAANAVGPLRLAQACRAAGARLLHVSTDYVFGGQATQPYEVDSEIQPLSAYGRSKAAGEWAVRSAAPECGWVVRTSWQHGGSDTGFLPTMLRFAREGRNAEVVDDARGQPTWRRHLATRLVALVEADAPPGVYHAAPAGSATWYEFAQAIYEEAGADPSLVRGVPSRAVPRPAARPAYSLLADDTPAQLAVPELPHWRAALHTAIAELGAAVPAG
jgi:dTDP-4-dehydrorhamnose reductase